MRIPDPLPPGRDAGPVQGPLGPQASAAFQAVLAKASELARSGRWEQAEDLLRQWPSEGPVPNAALDLLARIRAQQGRLFEAEALWTQASAADPGNERYKAALRRIARTRQSAGQRMPLAILALSLGILVGAVTVAFAARGRMSAVEARIDNLAAGQQSLSSRFNREVAEANVKSNEASAQAEQADVRIRSDLDGLLRTQADIAEEARREMAALGRDMASVTAALDQRSAEHAEAAARQDDALALFRSDLAAVSEAVHAMEKAAPKGPPGMRPDVPGITARTAGDSLILNFDEALFPEGRAELTPEGQACLDAVARELEADAGELAVLVVGYTDGKERPVRSSSYADPMDLAMGRAVAVVKHLMTNGRLSDATFSLAGMGRHMPPYPNDTELNRSRNRTVSLRIARKE
jgi:flagellar motor protein MotB